MKYKDFIPRPPKKLNYDPFVKKEKKEKLKVTWCWLGIHDWGKWQDYLQSFQKRYCKMCNKRQVISP